MNQYQRGDLVRTSAAYTNSGGTATDPGTVRASITNPAGSVTAYLYGTDAALVKDSTGTYHVDTVCSLAGLWVAEWTSAGGVTQADFETWYVVDAPSAGARVTMADLIGDVRDLVGDFGGTAQVFTDRQVLRELDARRREIVFEPMYSQVRQVAGGSIAYYDYYAGWGCLEATDGGTAVFTIQDSTGATQGTAGWSADYRRGHVTFTTDRRGTAYYLTARAYDTYGAAAALLRQWATRLAREFDFSTDGQSFSRSQQTRGLLTQAQEYERQSWSAVGSVRMVRSDLAGGWYADER